MFIDSIKNSWTLSFDSWSTDRKTIDTQLEYQVDIRSAQNKNSPKFLMVTHQTAVRIGFPNKAKIVAVSDMIIARKNHFDIYGVRYPLDGVSIVYTSNDYLDQF